MKNKKVSIVTNDNGVQFKKCCASCQHKDFSKLGDRICTKGEGEVPKDYVCADYALHKKLKNIRLNGDGRIKKPTYIAWLKEQVSMITASPSIDQKIKKEMVEALPAKYEQQFGSRYI